MSVVAGTHVGRSGLNGSVCSIIKSGRQGRHDRTTGPRAQPPRKLRKLISVPVPILALRYHSNLALTREVII